MLRDFIVTNREEILAQTRARVFLRSPPLGLEAEHTHGLPVFLDQLGEALRRAALREVVDHAEIHRSASDHGSHLFDEGLTVAQVVNSYGDLCQVITGLAVDQDASISAADFQTLNLCLDDATAGAVTAFAAQRERAISHENTEQLGVLAHEMRNALNSAFLAFASIKKGTVAVGGSTGAILDRSLVRLQALVDRTLADVRLEAGLLSVQRVAVWEVIEETEIGAAFMAHARGVHVDVAPVDHLLVVEADRPILAAAIANLLQNAFKFTKPDTTVKLRAFATTTRVLIEIEDECGGLPEGDAESLLMPFVQRGRDRSGLGLGLAIVSKSMKLLGGELRIKDLPGQGCIFTIDLPKQPPPPTSIFAAPKKPRAGKGGSEGSTARSP